MSFHIKDDEYSYLVKDILNNKEFNELSTIAHHGETRLDHSLRVSYFSYKISKALKLDFKETTLAFLLHYFYLDTTKDYKNMKYKVKLFSIGHPEDALVNANKLFYLSEKEKDIIRTHMFPIGFKIPKYLESWVVNMVDTSVSVYEFTRKFSYQLSTAVNIWLILFINLRK